MTQLNYDSMGKEALRDEMRSRELSYSKLNNDGMRAALRANDADMQSVMDDEDSFEMSTEELAAQAGRQSSVVINEDDWAATCERNDIAGQRAEPAAPAPAAKPAAPRTRKGVTIEKNREEKNGVKRPSLGGVCREVWDFCDATPTPTAKAVREQALVAGWNPNNAAIEFYQWRKFNGISGRVSK
jgi:hypothetical protein